MSASTSDAYSSRLDERETVRARLAKSVRALQNEIRGTLIEDSRAESMASEISVLVAELRAAGSENDLGSLSLEPGWMGGSQVLGPLYEVTSWDGARLQGMVSFTRVHLGRGAAVHGGAISLFADDVLGRLAFVTGSTPTRTAFLHVDYRALVPVGRPVPFEAWVDRVEGRKLHLAARIMVDDAPAAEAHGLWVAARLDESTSE